MTMKFAGDGSLLAKAERNGEVQIWNPYMGTLLTTFKTVHDGYSRLAVDSRGERIVAANWREGEDQPGAESMQFSPRVGQHIALMRQTAPHWS